MLSCVLKRDFTSLQNFITATCVIKFVELTMSLKYLTSIMFSFVDITVILLLLPVASGLSYNVFLRV